MSSPISVLLPTYNCAPTLRATLESVKWASEILIVDSFSTDETLDICREYDARIVQHEYINSAKQKNWAISQCRYEWILQIDSDEVLEPGLRDEIEEAIVSAPQDVCAFRIPRKNCFLGRYLRYGGNFPDYQTRLFRRDKGRWKEREVHAHLQVDGQVRNLEHTLLHDDWSYLAKPLRNLNRYTRYEADELYKNGIHHYWHAMVLRPWVVFLHRYFWLQGFRDGWRGYVFSVYMAMYVFLSRAKLWEMELLNRSSSPKLPKE
jgi:glycosyltransferase involved in cell wall biosynthesis